MASRSDRSLRLSGAFEGLGRQVHLIQDSASPGHTRNDPHLFYNYESVVDAIRQNEPATFLTWLAASNGPDAGWRELESHPLAPIAVARLIDSDRYSGANPDVTTTALIGLAEYTNANFFSEDRIFTENEVDPQKRFPFPNRGSVAEEDFEIQVGNATVKRRYFVKTGDGAIGYRLATVGFLRDYHQRFGLDWTRFRESPALDEGVYRDYAARLVPRAVAYSTALLDYFFRGQVAAFGDDLAMRLQNLGDEGMEGTFTLYYDGQDGVRRPVPGATWTRAVGPGVGVEGLRFISPASPAPQEPGKYVLVFRGLMGTERDAVAGRQVTVDAAVVPRLLKRKDGTPLRGSIVQTIDVQDGQLLSTGVTDGEGRARLTWRPGRTALFVPSVNLFPMYWAGGSAYSSGLEGARVIQSVDIDAQGQLTVLVPVVSAEWTERIEPCTEQPQFANSPRGVFQLSVPVSEGVLDLISVTYGVNLITFVRDDNGQETILCGEGAPDCQTPAAAFVAEDVNRVGQVVGQLVRDVRSAHFRSLVDTDLRPLGAPVCALEYEEIAIVPVTIAER